MSRKLVIVGAILLLVIAFFAFDLDRWLTLDALKASQARFEEWRSASPLLVAGAFFVVYVLVTALSLPGAAVMTLAAGALFGLVTGTILVSFASSIGATLAFLASRFVLRDSVQRRFGERLKAVNEGMARDGAFYLFPDLSAHRGRLAAQGVVDSASLAERLLEDTGVATLPGSVFGRPREELTLRLSYVNFDGRSALAAAEAGEPVDEDFVRRRCPATVAAIERIADWLG